MATSIATAAPEKKSLRVRLRGAWHRLTPNPTDEMWPYGLLAAVLLVPLLWILLGLVLWGFHELAGWPTAATSSGIVYIVAAVGLIPFWLLLLDSLAKRGAVVTVSSVTVDFSKTEATMKTALVRLEPPEIRGQALSDSNVGLVHNVILGTSNAEVVYLDLGNGDEWWMTRLFALCAGTVDAGTPEAIVFVGTRSESGRSTEHAFLGWVGVRPALRTLLAERPELKRVRDRSRLLTQLVDNALAAAPAGRAPVRFPPGTPPELLGEARTYARNPAFKGLGAALDVRILLDQLGRVESESNPRGGERVTRATLTLFGESLYTDSVPADWPDERKVDAILRAQGRFVGETDDGELLRLYDHTVVQNDVLRQLALPSAKRS